MLLEMMSPLWAMADVEPWASLPGLLLRRAIAGQAEGVALPARARVLEELLTAAPGLEGAVKAYGPGEANGTAPGPIRVIPMFGLLMQHPSWASYYGLATSVDQVQAEIRRCVADPQCSGVALRIYSPGGNVHGVKVLADYIRSVRDQKPIWAHADSMANSAAYWIMASCSRASCTPMGEVGAIGAFTIHTSYKGMDEALGIKRTIVKAGKMKALTTELEDLTEDARTNLQAKVEAAYEEFAQAVAKGRGVSLKQVQGGMGEGAVVEAKEALSMKMIDEVVSFADTLEKLAKQTRSGSKGAVRAVEGSELELLQWQADLGLIERSPEGPLT